MASKVSSAAAYSAYKKNEQNNPGKFTYTAKKPTWSYDSRDIDKYYKELLNRKDFSFDLNGSALYNQYKDYYQKQGQLAMMDTVGQASAMTGGYGNSYAASAGAQAYQQNLDKLSEVVPDIYNLALQQYQLEGQNLLDKYGVATDKKQEAYSEYRDSLSDYYTDRDYAYGQHRDSVADYEANRNFLYGAYEDARDYEYQQERDAVADNQWAEELAQQQRQYAEEMAYQRERAAVADSQWAQELAEQQRQYNENMSYQQSRDETEDMKWSLDTIAQQSQYEQQMKYQQERDSVSDSQWAQELAEQQRQYENNYYAEYGIEPTLGNNTESHGAIIGTATPTSNSVESGLAKAQSDLEKNGKTTIEGVTLNKSEYVMMEQCSQVIVDNNWSNSPDKIKAYLDELLQKKTITRTEYSKFTELFIK